MTGGVFNLLGASVFYAGWDEGRFECWYGVLLVWFLLLLLLCFFLVFFLFFSCGCGSVCWSFVLVSIVVGTVLCCVCCVCTDFLEHTSNPAIQSLFNLKSKHVSLARASTVFNSLRSTLPSNHLVSRWRYPCNRASPSTSPNPPHASEVTRHYLTIPSYKTHFIAIAIDRANISLQ